MLKYNFIRKKIKIYVGVEYRLEFIYNIKNIKKNIDINIINLFKKVVMY